MFLASFFKNQYPVAGSFFCPRLDQACRRLFVFPKFVRYRRTFVRMVVDLLNSYLVATLEHPSRDPAFFLSLDTVERSVGTLTISCFVFSTRQSTFFPFPRHGYPTAPFSDRPFSLPLNILRYRPPRRRWNARVLSHADLDDQEFEPLHPCSGLSNFYNLPHARQAPVGGQKVLEAWSPPRPLCPDLQCMDNGSHYNFF